MQKDTRRRDFNIPASVDVSSLFSWTPNLRVSVWAFSISVRDSQWLPLCHSHLAAPSRFVTPNLWLLIHDSQWVPNSFQKVVKPFRILIPSKVNIHMNSFAFRIIESRRLSRVSHQPDFRFRSCECGMLNIQCSSLSLDVELDSSSVEHDAI